MNSKIKPIISKTTELAVLFNAHPASVEYTATSEAIRKDIKSQRLLERLVFLGKDISEKLSAGGDIERNAEYELMREDFEKNPLIKKHIMAQKEYLSLLRKLIFLIKNPDSEDNETE